MTLGEDASLARALRRRDIDHGAQHLEEVDRRGVSDSDVLGLRTDQSCDLLTTRCDSAIQPALFQRDQSSSPFVLDDFLNAPGNRPRQGAERFPSRYTSPRVSSVEIEK